MANPTERREHERIDLHMPTRLWLDEKHNGRQIVFEGFAHTRNLAIGGTFIDSTYLLPVGFPINLEMRIDELGEILYARGEVTHKVGEGETDGPGIGIAFTAVDETNRERLLRFFVSDRIRDFYENRFIVEFPKLQENISLKDVALIVNLWEDRDGRLAALKHDGPPQSAVLRNPPPRIEAGKKRPSHRA